MLYAVLTDTSTGTVLLVRRRRSALWSLPAGEIRDGTPFEELLTSYCQRQTGIVPENFSVLQPFTFGGIAHVVGTAPAIRARAGARGRIEAIQWAPAASMPTGMDPVARVAVATMLTQIQTRQATALPDVVTNFLSA